AGKKSAQIREILISESAWEEMTCLFAPSLTSDKMYYLLQKVLAAVRTTLLDLSTSDNRILITDGYRGSAMNRIPQPETVRPVRSKCDLPCLVLII
ncbi:hypothetical protein M2X94_28270, partial [Klebsiella pneumoniae]|nr:hypothetical protein [Klebsiella pneumoniae]